MEKAKHTPGPWEYFPAKDQDGDETISVRGDGEFIATLDTVSINFGPFRLPKNGEANARLIAAAPDLLEACKESHRRGVAGVAEHNGGEKPDICWLCAAIAKAEGREKLQ